MVPDVKSVTHEPNAVRITESHGNIFLDLKAITIIYICLPEYKYIACEGEKWDICNTRGRWVHNFNDLFHINLY